MTQQIEIKGEWRDISSAPRDGTRILGYGQLAGEVNGPSEEYEIVPIEWRGGFTDYVGYNWYIPFGDAYAAWLKPTHWMPLPDKPHTQRNV